MQPNTTLTISSYYYLSPTATGSVSNTATVSATTTDPVSSNNSATTTATIVPPYTCQAKTTAVPARAESTTELVADLIITCTGGVPTSAGNGIPTDTITLTFNANVNSRILNSANNASEALALLDEPQPGAQFPCDPSVVCANYGNGTGKRVLRRRDLHCAIARQPKRLSGNRGRQSITAREN